MRSPSLSPASWFAQDFFQVPVIAVLRGLTPAEAVKSANRAWDVGVEHVEIPIETPLAVPTLQAVAGAAAELGLSAGAGTVTTVEQLDVASATGCSFTVSPGLDEGIILESARRNLPHLPGVATASEILRAQALGLSWLKAFPASELGPGWVKAMKGPFPHINFIATGGMRACNALSFLESGTSVVGLGSDFGPDGDLEAVSRLIAERET